MARSKLVQWVATRKKQPPREEQVLDTQGFLDKVLLLEEYIPDSQHCPADLSTDIWQVFSRAASVLHVVT